MFPVVPRIMSLEAQFNVRRARLRTILADHLEALRPHHWIKNLLVFLPLVLAHRMHDLQLVQRCILAFIAFSLSASAVYLMNDVLDVESDRLHPQKRLRPLASGRVSATASFILLGVLVVVASATALLVSVRVLQMLGLYFGTMTVYSLWAKRTPIVDVLLLAGGYALRVLTGSFAASLVPQEWLMAFCVFLFFSLALIKRYAELLASSHRTGGQGYVLGYSPQDAAAMLAMGSAAGYLAVLVLALDTTAGLATHAAGNHAGAWIVCALLFFWVSHMWLMAHRERIQEDPVLYAIKKPGSLIPLILIALVGVAGI